jgi:DNA-binding NarL/FixJ family response regulator
MHSSPGRNRDHTFSSISSFVLCICHWKSVIRISFDRLKEGNPLMGTVPIKILAVDDHPFLRRGLASLIDEAGDMQVVAEASNALEALELFIKFRPDVTLMDLQLPDLSGFEAILLIRQKYPEARIIVLTTYEGDIFARRALKVGATGYLLKSMIREELINAIRMVHSGKRHIPQSVASSLAEHYQDDDLTAREIEVLKSVAEGKSNKIIASRLFISEATVKAHMKNVLLKLGASDRTHAVGIASSRGFLM